MLRDLELRNNHLEYLYAPWREEYFSEKRGDECVFCYISKNPLKDEETHTFYRDDFVFCVMNKYPYTPGHFLIIPHLHVDSPELLDMQTWQRICTFVQKGVPLLKEFGAQGVNVGLNLHKAGGAGIPSHLHMHVLPRWIGDTNFLTSIGDSRSYGVDFQRIFEEIKTLAQKHFKISS